jgi:dsDNA-specific endonuclease/ATPase MutS2
VAEQIQSLGALRAHAFAIEDRVREMSGTVSRLAEAGQHVEATASRAEKFLSRAEDLEREMEQLRQLLKDVPNTKRELSTLNVLAEYVSRKVSTLESQRDLVDRVSQRAGNSRNSARTCSSWTVSRRTSKRSGSCIRGRSTAPSR